jgi:hypothetical protein
MFFHPGIAILVDCWGHLDQPIYQETWQNISKKINEYNIQTIVLSTHEYDIQTHWNTEWFINSHHIFFNGNPNYADWVRSLPNAIGSAPGFIYQTAPEIMNIKIPGKLKLLLHDPDQLIWYLNEVVPDYTNVWYFGCHWDICIADRDIGYKTLYPKLKKDNKRCFTDLTCVVTEDHQWPQINNSNHWHFVENNIYELKY